MINSYQSRSLLPLSLIICPNNIYYSVIKTPPVQETDRLWVIFWLCCKLASWPLTCYLTTVWITFGPENGESKCSYLIVSLWDLSKIMLIKSVTDDLPSKHVKYCQQIHTGLWLGAITSAYDKELFPHLTVHVYNVLPLRKHRVNRVNRIS